MWKKPGISPFVFAAFFIIFAIITNSDGLRSLLVMIAMAFLVYWGIIRLGWGEQEKIRIKQERLAEDARIQKEKIAEGYRERAERWEQLSQQEKARFTGEVFVPPYIGGLPLAYHYDNVRLFIVPGHEPHFTTLEPGMSVKLIAEPENPYDKGAVCAMADHGIKIGYLYKGKMQDMVNDFLQAGNPILSHITSVNDSEGKIEIFLGFYKSLGQSGQVADMDGQVKQSTTFKLADNLNQGMQENIDCCSKGDTADNP